MGVIEETITHLRQWHRCPACGVPAAGPSCTGCGVELTSEAAKLLVARSEAAAEALELRQQALSTLIAAGRVLAGAAAAPTGPTAVAGSLVAAGTGAQLASHAGRPAAPTGRPQVPAGPVVPKDGATLPNPVAVFSAVGVGAIVAAALVFAVLVPADPTLVRLSLVGVTVASAAAMLALRRRRPVSAAAVAVGTVALALLVIALFVRPLGADDALLAASVAVGCLAGGLGWAGFALRLRPWVSAGVLLAPFAAALAAAGLLEIEPWGSAAALVAAVALAAAGRWAARRWQGGRPGPLPLAPERALLGVAGGFGLVGAVAAALLGAADQRGPAAPLSALLLLGAAGAAYLHGAGPDAGWRRAAGVVGVLAPVGLVLGEGGPGLAGCVAAGAGWIALAAASSHPALRDGRLAGVLTGGWVAVLLLTTPAAFVLLGGVAAGIDRGGRNPGAFGVLVPGWELPAAGWAVASVLVSAAVSAVAASLPPERFGPPPAPTVAPAGWPAPSDPGSMVPRLSLWLWPWLTLIGLAAAVAIPILPTAASVALLLLLALGCAVVAGVVGMAVPPLHAAARIGGAALVVLAAFASWDAPVLALAAGPAVIALGLGWTRLLPPPARPVLVGLGYAYGLVLLGHALSWYPIGWQAGEWTPVAGLLAVATSLVSLAVLTTPGRGGSTAAAAARSGAGRLDPTTATVLAVGTVPWLLAGLTVVEDRSWWAAAAAASVLAVEFRLAVRARRQPTWLRVAAAASLLPTAGVVLVNAGAMLIPTSGSPILLPVVAAMASATAVAATDLTARVAGIDDRAAGLIRRALEIGSLLTAIACVGLAVTLPAAGPATSLVVCAILAAGAAVVATRPDRRWVWLLAGLAAAGMLWSALVLLEVGLVEAYTVPVGLAAVGVGLVLARHDRRWWTLATAGLLLALLPTWLLAAAGAAVIGRTSALTGVAVVLVAVAGPVRRRLAAGAPAALWSLAGGIAVAGSAGFLLAVRSSGRVPPGDPALADLLDAIAGQPFAGFSWAVATAAVAAVFLGVAGQVARWATAAGPARARRAAASWRFAPALAVAAAGAVLAVRPGAGVVPATWLLCLGLLAVTVASTALRVRGRVVLPPVWFCWLLALAVGIAGWSLRELRVEHHSLPLGLVLLACGVMGFRAAQQRPVRRRSWPIGVDDPALAITPGVLAILGPSTLAIGTDPQTWRAILVLVLALAALLVGARMLWRACLVVGIVDLAVAILLVFVARRGAIDAVPWLIALIGAGGVLLGLAIYSERRQHALAEPA